MIATPTKLAIAIDLDQLRNLMREFIDEHADSNSSLVQMEWTFETFLQWLTRKRQEVAGDSQRANLQGDGQSGA